MAERYDANLNDPAVVRHETTELLQDDVETWLRVYKRNQQFALLQELGGRVIEICGSGKPKFIEVGSGVRICVVAPRSRRIVPADSANGMYFKAKRWPGRTSSVPRLTVYSDLGKTRHDADKFETETTIGDRGHVRTSIRELGRDWDRVAEFVGQCLDSLEVVAKPEPARRPFVPDVLGRLYGLSQDTLHL